MKHFIFDIDGTLLDTETPLLLSWQKTLHDHGYDATESEVRSLMGLTIMSIVKKTGIDAPANIDEIWQDNYAIYADTVDYFPGVLDMINKLKANPEVALGVVSSRARSEIDNFFTKFGFKEIFPIMILSDDTVGHKPLPDPILKYMELTGATPSECVYFGDMPGDIDCAKAAGITAVLCTWNGSGYTHPNADYTFDNVNQIIDLLDK